MFCMYFMCQLKSLPEKDIKAKSKVPLQILGFPWWLRRWSRERLPTPVFLPREFHGLYSPCDRSESDTTERLSLSLQKGTSQQCMYCAVLQSLSHVQFFVTLWTVALQVPLSTGIFQARIPEQVVMTSSRGYSSWVFSTQESKPGLLPCRQILYCLSHQSSPIILEWVAYPFFWVGFYPTQKLNWTLLHCWWILYQSNE